MSKDFVKLHVLPSDSFRTFRWRLIVLSCTAACLRFCSGEFGQDHLVNHLIHKLAFPQMAFIFKYYFIAQWECALHYSPGLMWVIAPIIKCKKKLWFQSLITVLFSILWSYKFMGFPFTHGMGHFCSVILGSLWNKQDLEMLSRLITGQSLGSKHLITQKCHYTSDANWAQRCT